MKNKYISIISIFILTALYSENLVVSYSSGTKYFKEMISLENHSQQFPHQFEEGSTRNRNDNVAVTVYDHLGNTNDNATVYFISTEFDTSIAVPTDSAGIASYELEIGSWSTYAHNNTDNGTYIDLWDGGVFYTSSDSGNIHNLSLFLYPRNEYGFLIASVRTYNEDNDTLDFIPHAGIMIDDTSGNTIYYGITNVWGDIGTPLLPEQEYNVTLSYDGNFYQQSLYIDTTNTYYELLFQFGGDGDDNEDENEFDLEINGFHYLGTHGEHYYYVSNDTMTWYEAYNITEELNTDETMEIYMATISSIEENSFIQTSFDTVLWNQNSLWIGLTDAQNEGNWEWVNGEELLFTNWNDGEPNNSGGGEDFVELRRYDGLWNDLSNNNDRSFIIEIELRGNPTILSIEDIPNDQGGRVYLSFSASSFDHVDEASQTYGIMRFDEFENDSSGWVAITSFPAIGDPIYTFEVPTLFDSTQENSGLTEFKVVAAMNAGVFYSEPMLGYSIDNLTPGIPDGLHAITVNDGIYLSWNASIDEDFQYFILEKSFQEEFIEVQSIETIDTSYIDTDYTYNEPIYYRILAVDFAGNHSEYSQVINATVLTINENNIPEKFALHQNYPNPFNPITILKYDLPNDSFVHIKIYDIVGNIVANLVKKDESSGYKTVQWNGINDEGQRVSAGVYLYNIETADFIQTKKMILLK